MSDEELKCWFFNKFNNCYQVKHKYFTNTIYFVYDESYIRKSKLSALSNNEVTLPTNVSGICLFKYNIISGHIWFDCDYYEIWVFFYKNSTYDYLGVQSLLKSWLSDKYNHNNITVDWDSYIKQYTLEDIDKLSVYKSSAL